MLPEVTAFWTNLGQNLELYKKYKALSQSAEFSSLDSAQRKVIDNSLRDFRLGGAELSDEQKIRFAEIQDQQAQLSKEFSDHVLDATDHFVHLITDEKDLAGLPEDAIAAAKQTAESKELTGWAFTLHFPSYFPDLLENNSMKPMSPELQSYQNNLVAVKQNGTTRTICYLSFVSKTKKQKCLVLQILLP
jgi:oligopeptidase A